MINNEDLIEGRRYFLVWYFDGEMNIPDIETHIYVGKNIFEEGDDNDSWYFQDPESYITQGVFSTIEDKSKCELLKADKDTLDSMYNLDGLIVELERLRNL